MEADRGNRTPGWGASAKLNEQKTVRISFAGDLDVYRRDEIASALPPAQDIDRLIIDLRETAIIDSTILSLFMRYRRAFIEAGNDPHEIVIIVKPQLRRIFEITGLLKTLTVVSAGDIGSTGIAAAEPLSEL